MMMRISTTSNHEHIKSVYIKICCKMFLAIASVFSFPHRQLHLNAKRIVPRWERKKFRFHFHVSLLFPLCLFILLSFLSPTRSSLHCCDINNSEWYGEIPTVRSSRAGGESLALINVEILLEKGNFSLDNHFLIILKLPAQIIQGSDDKWKYSPSIVT